MVNLKHVEQVVRTRIRVAQRWFGLHSEADIRQFVLADPEVQALEADEVTRQEVACGFVRRIATALACGDHAELRDLKTQLGPEMYDRVVGLTEARPG